MQAFGEGRGSTPAPRLGVYLQSKMYSVFPAAPASPQRALVTSQQRRQCTADVTDFCPRGCGQSPVRDPYFLRGRQTGPGLTYLLALPARGQLRIPWCGRASAWCAGVGNNSQEFEACGHLERGGAALLHPGWVRSIHNREMYSVFAAAPAWHGASKLLLRGGLPAW